jgi:sugar-specific transcriptional regulator TrmB
MKSQDLQKLGFTSNEAKIYLTLVEFGALQAGQLSKRSQINRRTTYDTIERMIEKGFLSYSLVANRRIFKALNPKIIISKIREMEEQAQEIVPQLSQLYASSKDEQEANIYKGRKGIRNILNDLLTVRNYVGFGSNEKFPEIMKHDFAIFQKKKKRLGIKSKTLMNMSMRKKEILKMAFTEYRFLSEKQAQPTSTFVYGNKVAIIVWSTVPVGMVIESKKLAETYWQYFNALWKTARK